MAEKETCLHSRHVALGANMVPFGGFDMPLFYSNIVDEHNAVRHGCGIFDVSHMGEITVCGTDAEAFVQHIFTNDISLAPVGKIFYGMMLYDNGGTVDDLLVYKMGEARFFLVVNAANIEKDFDWIKAQSAGFNVDVTNASERYGQIAVQGPEAERVIGEALSLNGTDLTFYTFKVVKAPNGEDLILSRTGYTGEDGFEIYGSPAYIGEAWDALLKHADVVPCGLGCRDTLRFEVGLPLYGDELSADISPIMAGLSMFVKLDKPDFVGKEAVAKQKADGVARRIVGIELADHAIPRHGYEVQDEEGHIVGEVTTGYKSISTGKSVCMALVETAHAKLGTPLKVCIHRKLHDGIVTKKRFYDKHYKK